MSKIARSPFFRLPTAVVCLLIDHIIFLADFMIVAIGLVGSATIVFLIIGRYIYTRKQFLSWDVRDDETSIESDGQDVTTTTALPRHACIYDRWLLVRFTIGLLALG